MIRTPGREDAYIDQIRGQQVAQDLKKDGHEEQGIERYYDIDTELYPRSSKLLVDVIRWVLLIISKIWTRWSVEGEENLTALDRNQGAIFVANHTSLIDPILFVCAQLRSRRIRFLYKKEFDDNPFLTFLFARLGALPLVRGTADRKALKRAVKALERGEDVGIFPEGTRIKSRFGRGEIHGGFALIAHSAQAPIVPVAIEGAWALPIPRKIRMKIGAPIYLDEFNHLERRERIAALEERAMSTVFALREELDMRNADYHAAHNKLMSSAEKDS